MTTRSSGPQQAAVLAPGTVFARDYVVVSQLASGGMGTVYVVEQRGTRRRRALKLMHPELVHDEKLRERFEREATIGSRIDSEHVVDVVAAGVDETTGDPWLVMELLEGTDLAARIATEGPMPRAEVLEAFRQLCHALDAAHRAGIVHRDLKPENVFLARARRSDARFTVKVLDFGIAKWLQEARAATMASQSIGTPLWMAPEQMEARGQIGDAADIWPLGLIGFYLLTGKLYWAAAHEKEASLGAVLAEIVALPIERPSVRAAQLGVTGRVPAGFDEWFIRCVARDPAQRFASADDALRALEPVLGAPQAVAHTVPMPGAPSPGFGAPAIGPPAIGARPTGASRDGRTVAVASSPTQRMLGAAPEVGSVGAPPVALAPMPERRGGRGLLVALVVLLVAGAGIAGIAVLLKGRGSRTRQHAGPDPTLPQLPPAPTIATPPTLPPPPPPPPPRPPPVLYTGGSAPDNLGCIPCDGQSRYMGPGMPGVALGLEYNNPAALSKSVPLPTGGTIEHFTVTASSSDGGEWSYELWVNGRSVPVGCSIRGMATSCSDTRSFTINAGDRVTVAVGNPGVLFDSTRGQGRFQVTYSFTLQPP